MNVHHNAWLTARGRERIVHAILARQLSVKAAALQSGLSERSVRKWLARFRAEGTTGLRDRSSRPHRSPRQTPAAQVAVVLALRRLRLPGFQIARQRALSRATVSRLLRRHGLARLRDLEPAPPVVRYQRQLPGELLHFDIKKLGRIVRPSHRVTGDRRDQVRGLVGSLSTFASMMLPGSLSLRLCPMKVNTARFSLERSLAYFASLGIKTQRIMSDNGSCYRSHLFRAACQRHALRHLFTRPYTPHQWQSRTLHPNFLTRIGLRCHLLPLRSPRRSSSTLAPSLQLAPPSLRSPSPTPHFQTQFIYEQPLEPPQLGRDRSLYRQTGVKVLIPLRR